MFGISLARISLLTGTSLGGGVGVSPTLDLNFRGQGYSAAMAGYTFNQLIDFTRTSSATYVDATGKIVSTPASQNLLTFTQEFDNAAWAKTAATVTANAATAPDGTLTADKLIENTATGSHRIYQGITTSSIPYTASAYLKKGGRNWAYIRLDDSTSVSRHAWFNLDNGSVGTVETGLTATISSVGNGWYRCSARINAALAGTSNILFGMASADNVQTYTGDGTSGVFLWGAQLEAGSTATDYTRNNGGVFPPRFDYDPVTLAPRGLLVEEQRTNLLLRSEEFDNASWSKSRSSVTASATTSPDGTVDADKLVEDTTAASTHFTTQTATVASGATVTCSVYAKAAERTRVVVQENNSGATVAVNLANGSIISGSGTVQDAGNGWYRISVTGTVPATTAIMGIYLRDATSSSYTGDGTSGIYIWGAQLGAGAFATSYIPTVASQVTRTADVATITGANFSQWYNQSEGTFVVEAATQKPTSVAATAIAIDASDGGINNRNYIGVVSASAEVRTVNGGSVQSVLIQAYTANVVEKYAYAMKANDFAFFRNGSQAGTDTSGTIPTVDRMFIGNAAGSAAFWNGWLRSIRYYPSRLTQAQGQALTA